MSPSQLLELNRPAQVAAALDCLHDIVSKGPGVLLSNHSSLLSRWFAGGVRREAINARLLSWLPLVSAVNAEFTSIDSLLVANPQVTPLTTARRVDLNACLQDAALRERCVIAALRFLQSMLAHFQVACLLPYWLIHLLLCRRSRLIPLA